MYAAFDAATKHVGQPTVILAHTIKGWTIDALEGKNATHQMKKLNATTTSRRSATGSTCRSATSDIDEPTSSTARAVLPPGRGLPRDRVHAASAAAQLGGSLPKRRVDPTPLKLPGDEMYAELKQGSGKQKIATTMAFVRLLRT